MVSLCICAEVTGRKAVSDVTDLVMLLTLVAGIVIWQRHDPVSARGLRRLLQRGLRTLVKRVRPRGFEMGLDLRGEPPLPRALPPAVYAAPIALLAVIALKIPGVLPDHDARWFAREIAYLPQLALTALVWLIALQFILLVPLRAWQFVTEFVRRARVEGRALPHWLLRATASPGPLLAAFGGLLIATLSLPGWMPLLALAAVWTHYAWTMARVRHLTLGFAWRSDRSPVARTFSWRTAKFLATTSATLGVVATVALLDAQHLAPWATPVAGPEDFAWPISGALASAVAWFGGLTHAAFLLSSARFIRRAAAQDPARSLPPRVHVPTTEARPPLIGSLLAQGFELRMETEPERGDVGLDPRPGPILRDPFSPITWPLAIDREAPIEDIDRERILRRDVQQRRRQLRRGFERLFKAAHRLPDEEGNGYWLGPHLWVMVGMSRDPQEPRRVGPRFEEVFTLRARSHIHEILKGGGVDLVFVEDGVRWRHFRNVLEALFEHHDLHDGARPFDERSFVGVEGVRVLVHDHSIEEPKALDEDGYPEPEYQDLGRASILHVFRDRGGREAPAPVPGDVIDAPLPMLSAS